MNRICHLWFCGLSFWDSEKQVIGRTLVLLWGNMVTVATMGALLFKALKVAYDNSCKMLECSKIV